MPGHNDWYSVNLDPFSINFSPYPFKEMSFRDACDHTARLIADKFDNLHLAFSGGYDSELVANVLLRNSIPFTPVIWRDLYSRESDFALHWCRKHNVTPRVINGNVLDENLRKMLRKIASRFKSQDDLGAIPMMIARLIEKENGSLITGTGITASGGLEYPNIMSSFTEWQKNEILVDMLYPKHPGSFFFYTPEILLAYAKEVDRTLPTQEAKAILYETSFRPKIKPYHGCLVPDESYDESKERCTSGSIDDLIDHLCRFSLGSI